MHRYNNMDHSMLTAMAAVDNIVNGIISKENIWNINAEQDYQDRYLIFITIEMVFLHHIYT